MNRWLQEHRMPHITVVKNVDRSGNRLTLETECLRSGTLPSIAYGFKRCSQKHKIGPQEKFCNHHPQCRAVWQAGERVTRFIGYDAGEQKRYEHSKKYNEADKKYKNRYPLIEDWHWTRDDCIRAIQEAGLPLPGKSSCFFCPSDGSRVYTVEGNSGDACKIKSYSLTYECIKGYGLMNW